MASFTGSHNGVFFPNTNSGEPDYLNPRNPRYTPKLAAAVSAWIAVTDPKGRTPKQAIGKWAREHAAEFGLSDSQGNPVKKAMEEIEAVVNWEPNGGSPKTPGN